MVGWAKDGSASWGPANTCKQMQKTCLWNLHSQSLIKFMLALYTSVSSSDCLGSLESTNLVYLVFSQDSTVPGVCRFESLGILAHLVKWWVGCIITSESRGFRFHYHSQKVIGFVGNMLRNMQKLNCLKPSASPYCDIPWLDTVRVCTSAFKFKVATTAPNKEHDLIVNCQHHEA